ncbi:hypothetical protein V7S43_006791 [Phytophthora oleae]|uniref:Uncharacterized protein n=1 Tax=Phytophthora oleae TaxID=2107226 RepID=A0ABD3FME8_9STRA
MEALREWCYVAKRECGESVEEWADRVNDVSDSLDLESSRARFQLFCRGLRNKQALAVLASCAVCSIPEACEWLMMRDLYRPAVEDNEAVHGRTEMVHLFGQQHKERPVAEVTLNG